MTEAVDIEVTALLPVTLFPILGIAPVAKAAAPYASDAFFTLRLTGTRPGAMTAGFMVASAFLSMSISNTACAAMMVPIAISVIDLVARTRSGEGGGAIDESAQANFATGLLLAVLPPLALLLAVVTMTVFLSEVTSNTAQVATMTPVPAAMAPALGLDPRALVVVCALAASSAYMMPVGTPPNAIVFGTGLVRMPQMIRAGLLLNLSGIAPITALGWWLVPHFVGGR